MSNKDVNLKLEAFAKALGWDNENKNVLATVEAEKAFEKRIRAKTTEAMEMSDQLQAESQAALFNKILY